MTTSILIHPQNGLRLVNFRLPAMSKTKVARIYKPRDTIPETILSEVSPNSDRYVDDITGEIYIHTTEGLKLI